MLYTHLRCFCMSEDYISSIQTLSLKKKFLSGANLVSAFVGIHPQNATTLTDINLFQDFFYSHLDQIDGVGEIGLDPTYIDMYPTNSMVSQKFTFHKMLTLAEKTQKPISIHSRRSVGDIIEMLSSYRIKNAVFHWYEGSKKNLKKINEMGFFVSFGPYILYNKEKQNMLRESEKNLVLIETDGPVGYKGCLENVLTTPTLILSILYSISNIFEKPFQETSELLFLNASRFIDCQLKL